MLLATAPHGTMGFKVLLTPTSPLSNGAAQLELIELESVP